MWVGSGINFNCYSVTILSFLTVPQILPCDPLPPSVNDFWNFHRTLGWLVWHHEGPHLFRTI